MQDLTLQKDRVNQWMREHGAVFTVTRYGIRQSRPDAFDPIPRILSSNDFTRIESGLIQRLTAVNLFLNDIYRSRMILRDGVIPEEFVFSSPDFLPQCMQATPPKSIYSHIAATDLIRTPGGDWYVLDDCFSIPDGMTYPHLARKLCRELSPDLYDVPSLCDNCGLDILLKQLYHDIREDNPGLEDGIVILLQDSENNATAFELQYLAELTGATVASPEQLIVMDSKVYYHAPGSGFRRVGILHRLTLDHCLDPLCFSPASPNGIPHLMEVYGSGHIAILNAPGCSIAEDRGIYCYIPEMIRYYLDEEPLLPNVPSFLPWNADERAYILDHLADLVIKEVNTSDRSHASVFGRTLDAAGRERLARAIEQNPRHYIAQRVMDVERLPVQLADGSEIQARCDFRAFTVHSNSIRVWMGGLSRFTIHEEDGTPVTGFKDTWVMNQ